MVQVPEALLDRLLHTEAAHLACDQVRAVSMHEVLGSLNPERASKFMIVEIPKRFAVRIRMIERLTGWKLVPELVRMRDLLHKWFREIRLVQPDPEGFKDFIACAKRVRAEGRDTVRLATVGMQTLRSTAIGAEFSDRYVDKWLDDFLLLRIGTNMLLDQFIAINSPEDGGLGNPWGIVDRHCDAQEVCMQVAKYSVRLCEVHYGRSPHFKIETYCAEGAASKGARCTFSFIPGYLRYIMLELLKNSFSATLRTCTTEEALKRHPVHVLVCFDEGHCAIRVSDRAGGIPHAVGERIWSYLYGAAARRTSMDDDGDAPLATPLSGYGVGLPISRLHARYLGGRLRVQSFPGYGTDAYLNLPTITTQQVELVPS